MGISSAHEYSIDHMYGLLMSHVILYIYVPIQKISYPIRQLETHRHTLFSPLQIVYTLYMICPFVTFIYTHLILLQITYGMKNSLTCVTFFYPLSWSRFTTLQISPLLRLLILLAQVNTHLC
jgi:hypothetical protein